MQTILTEREGAVGTITFNRAERFNAMDVRMAQDFRRAALGFARDDAVRAVVLKGVPGKFCSGADLKFIAEGGVAGDLAYLTQAAPSRSLDGAPVRYGDVFKQILEYIHSAISEIRRSPKPFVAAIDGMAAAGGLGIAMACDVVLASERATFEWAYSKTGLTGAESATFMLPRLVGLRRAFELLFLNPRLSAEQAREYGLVTSVHPVEGFEAAVLDTARRLTLGPPNAFAISKELLNQASGMDRLDEHLDRELDALARAANGPEFAEGLRAFLDKRSPAYGRDSLSAGASASVERSHDKGRAPHMESGESRA